MLTYVRRPLALRRSVGWAGHRIMMDSVRCGSRNFTLNHGQLVI